MAFASSALSLKRSGSAIGRRCVSVGGRHKVVRHTMTASDKPVVLCPGQGAQVVGMGGAWLSRSSEAKALFERADRYLGDRLGQPLSEIILQGPKATLDRTNVAQPAIFLTSMAAWKGAVELELVIPEPATAAGLSLGEYTALTIGGAMEFEDALELVTLRGQAMQDASDAVPSTMCALVGADEDTAKQCIERGLRDCPEQVLVAANFNAPGQVVISGNVQACKAASTFASEELKLRAVMLDVAGAFHSPLMSDAAERLGEALAKTRISPPSCPVLANVTGKPYDADPDDIRKRLVEQLTNPTRWAACMEYYMGDAEIAKDGAWVELAPGKTLTGIMRKVNRRQKITSLDAPPED